jgi:hypothetical protein
MSDSVSGTGPRTDETVLRQPPAAATRDEHRHAPDPRYGTAPTGDDGNRYAGQDGTRRPDEDLGRFAAGSDENPVRGQGPGPDPEPGGPAPLDVPRTPTGNAEVDGRLERLADADHLTTDGHVEVYEDVHRGLRDALTALDARPGPPGPSVSQASPRPPYQVRS